MCLAGRTCCAAQAGLEVAYTDPPDCLPPKDWDRSVQHHAWSASFSAEGLLCLAQTILTVALSVLQGLDKCDTG